MFFYLSEEVFTREVRELRRKNKKKKQKVEQQTSTIGRIIDMPMEEFKEELVRQKVNIGVMNNLILNLEGSYAELKSRKDSVLDLVFKGMKSKDDPEITKSLEGLYAEMTKIEQKVVYLKQRVKELVDVDKTPN